MPKVAKFRGEVEEPVPQSSDLIAFPPHHPPIQLQLPISILLCHSSLDISLQFRFFQSNAFFFVLQFFFAQILATFHPHEISFLSSDFCSPQFFWPPPISLFLSSSSPDCWPMSIPTQLLRKPSATPLLAHLVLT